MKCRRIWRQVALLLMLVAVFSLRAGYATEEGWPRLYEEDGDKLVVYQPQIRSWKDHREIKGIAAIQLIERGKKEGIYGALELEAKTEVDLATRMVVFQDLKIGDIRFPGIKGSAAKRHARTVRDMLPRGVTSLPVALDRVIAAMDRSALQQRKVEVNLDPPPIFRSEKEAILVVFLGEPRFEPVKGTDLLFAANTNWDLFLEVGTATYYMLNGESWLRTKDILKGPWEAATTLPGAMAKLPDDENWQDVCKNVPGTRAQSVPAVFVSKKPAELIVTEGAPSLSPIGGTSLLYVSNTESDVFLHSGEGNYYFLAAGRWFRSKKLDGPWTAASKDLPADFAEIPEDHEKGSVLASVPGSSESEAAVLLASIPQKAKVDRKGTTVQVQYDGDPKFVVIEKTKVQYAINTPYSVFLVSGQYYCCHKGIWFVSSKATGPWAVCVKVPKAIYTIPPTHPKYNVTYVYVYDSTPDTVVVGYTSGYTGAYVAATGAVMFGLGYWIGHEMHEHWEDHYHGYHYHPHYYSYGCAARYDYYHGGYYRSARYYGPYGGAGRGAAYNPATGTYARGAYRYGPRGGAYARAAYNPHTDRYAAQARASTPYGSWGRTVVGEGDDWARAGHRSNWKGTVVGGDTSEGGKAVAGRNRWTGDSGFAGKDQYGDVYVGRDGNVYKREDGNWQKRSGGSWEDVERPSGRSGAETAKARAETFDRSRTSAGQGARGGTSDLSARMNELKGRDLGSRGSSGIGRSASRSGSPSSHFSSSRTGSQLNREFRSRSTGASRTRSYQQRSRSSFSRSSGYSRSRSGGASRSRGGGRR